MEFSKIKRLLVPFATLLMLVSCARPITSSQDGPSSTSAQPSINVTSETSTIAPTSTIKEEPTSNPGTTNSTTSSSTSTGVVNEQLAGYDYTIFSRAPKIKFVTDKGLDWATTPNKDSDKPEVSGKITTENCDEKYRLTDVNAAMKVRGNYTTNYQKKPFRIKFETKTNLFGLNGGDKYKKWVLLADVKDTAMLRNALSFYLGRNILGDNIHVSDFTPVNLYLNEQYWGVYLLVEQKEVGKSRVQMDTPSAGYKGNDIGYFFELDNYYEGEGPDGDPTFTVTYKPKEINYHHSGENFTRIQKGYTLSSDITNPSTQLPYISKRVEMAYTVLYNAAFNNKYQEIVDEQLVDCAVGTTLGECLAKTIDVDSFVGMYILNEIVCDPDVGYSSFYLSLDMSSKGNKLLTCNCPWDFDSALGIRKDTVENAKGLYVAESSNMWLSMIAKTSYFKDLVQKKWNEIKESDLFNRSIDMINNFASKYAQDYNSNFSKWPRTMGNNPETNFELRAEVLNFKNHTQAKSFLIDWYQKRINELDSLFAGVVHPSAQEQFTSFKADATKVRLEAENAVLGNVNGGDLPGTKEKENEGISGNKYVNNLDGKAGASMTFEYTSSKAQSKVLLSAGLSARENRELKFSDMFDITLNGNYLSPESIILPYSGNGADYHRWTSVDLCFASLVQGKNTIVISVGQNALGTNFDYLDIYLPKA